MEEQRSWQPLVWRIAIFLLALAILGAVVWFVVDRANNEEAATPQATTQPESEQNQPASEAPSTPAGSGQDQENGAATSTNNGQSNTDSSAQTTPSPKSTQADTHLPQSGPADIAGGLLVLPATGYSAYRLFKSRRELKNAHRQQST